MRKILCILFMALISLTSLVSCGIDSRGASDVISKDELIGTWATAFFYHEKIDGYIPVTSEEQFMVFYFNDDGSCYIGIGVDDADTFVVDWTLRRNIITMKSSKGKITMEAIKYDGKFLEVEMIGVKGANGIRCKLAYMD